MKSIIISDGGQYI